MKNFDTWFGIIMVAICIYTLSLMAKKGKDFNLIIERMANNPNQIDRMVFDNTGMYYQHISNSGILEQRMLDDKH
jgi:hypothetical protein